ncbi:hypothetical protein TS65_09845 [Aneurinibacillus migulanus]|uniref:DNA-entry nuclease n=1 Tax=Aneurinibacillus migulanus TaxID=47500 RepID=A0A0D1WG54_ANEMI|nr:hypothetical protein TS65_09845 [Aneurinibacillus migulanus]KON94870.1 hypothetical protein AF333_04580 [Aneurinibacillus migulanus]SDI92203.1 hypothetical protein SAMN04487909_109100 [Aneurinibacillus migulanus]
MMDIDIDTLDISYDSSGRMNFHPRLHPNQGKPFTEEEKEYLCKYYDIDGSLSMSYVLGRTQKSILNKISKLKRNGMFEYYRGKTHG